MKTLKIILFLTFSLLFIFNSNAQHHVLDDSTQMFVITESHIKQNDSTHFFLSDGLIFIFEQKIMSIEIDSTRVLFMGSIDKVPYEDFDTAIITKKYDWKPTSKIIANSNSATVFIETIPGTVESHGAQFYFIQVVFNDVPAEIQLYCYALPE